MFASPLRFVVILAIFRTIFGQGFPLFHSHHNHFYQSGKDKELSRLLITRNADNGIFDLNKLVKIVDFRSKLYDEAIRLSNVFPGQTTTVPVASRSKNRLSDFNSWSCDDCGFEAKEFLEGPSVVVDSQEEQEGINEAENHIIVDLSAWNEVSVVETNAENDEVTAFLESTIEQLSGQLTTDNPSTLLNSSLKKEAYIYIWESLSVNYDFIQSNQYAKIEPSKRNDFESNNVDNAISEPSEKEVAIPSLFATRSFSWLDFIDLLPSETILDNGESFPLFELIETFETRDNTSDIISEDFETIIVGESDCDSKQNDFIHIAEVDNILSLEFAETSQFLNEGIDFEDMEQRIFNISEDISLNNEIIVNNLIEADTNDSNFENLGDSVITDMREIVSSPAWKDESVTLAFSAVRLQLLIGLIFGTFLLSLVLIIRLYHYAVYYPTNLVLWLEEESTRLFAQGDFVQLTSILSSYLPRVEWYFGMKDLETIALLHYLARGQMALNQFDSAEKNLQKLLTVLEPYGEDAYLASVFEDYGFVLHSQGKFSESIQYLHQALRIISEEQVCQYEDGHGRVTEKYIAADRDDDSVANDHDRLIAADDSTVVDDMDALGENFQDEVRTPTGSNRPAHHNGLSASSSSSLAQSFGSPSTLDLNEAFFVHSNLTSAVKELEALLEEDANILRRHRQSQVLASWRRDELDDNDSVPLDDDEVFSDFIAVPSVEVARLCKKLGEVYRDNQDFPQARLFFENALSVARRLNSAELGMEEDILELKQLIAELPSAVETSIGSITVFGDKSNSHNQDSFMYSRFWVNAQ